MTPKHCVIVIPCYKVRFQIQNVLAKIPVEFNVVCVDDNCPEHTGDFVRSLKMANVTVMRNEINLGVGGATKVGMLYAFGEMNAELVVKVDGDDQMDISQLQDFIGLADGVAYDFCKGNRLTNFQALIKMPKIRLFGNSLLTLMTRVSTGYWDISDPVNGFFAITRNCFYDLPLEKIRNDYVFETSLLNELSMKNKIVAQVDGPVIYNHQSSSLRPFRMILPLLRFHVSACLRRILFKYFLREFNVGTFLLVTGAISAACSLIVAYDGYTQASITKHPAASGIVGMSVLLAIIAYISFIAFIFYDMSSNPNRMNYQRIISWLYKNEKNSSSNRR